jgi:hypothetical protein
MKVSGLGITNGKVTLDDLYGLLPSKSTLVKLHATVIPRLPH